MTQPFSAPLTLLVSRLRPISSYIWSMKLLALVVSTTACSGIGDLFREPEIQLDRAIVRAIGVTGGNLDLVLKVENPNNFTLKGTRLQLGVDVEGSHLGDVTYDDDFAVPENGTTTITLPLTFGWAGVGSAVRAALGSGDLPYKMKGQAELQTPWGRQKVPFTREGRVPLTRSGRTIAIPAHTP
jgi:LEA14-like dessication related protein